MSQLEGDEGYQNAEESSAEAAEDACGTDASSSPKKEKNKKAKAKAAAFPVPPRGGAFEGAPHDESRAKIFFLVHA